MERFEGCELDRERHELRRDGEPVAIEPQALRILIELLDNRDRVVTKQELLDAVWGGRFVGESALTTQIKGLRRAVGDTGREQRVIKTVHGRGYMFVASVADAAGDTPTNGGERGKPLLAVLPFHNLSPDPEQGHVADGITHDIVAALSKHRWLRVLARPTANRYRDDPDPVSALRDGHQVDYLVEGSVRRAGGRLRVTTTLTDAETGNYTWAETFDRDIEDLFAVQDEITRIICAAIEPEVGYAERERATRLSAHDLRAWDLFHLGLAAFYRFTSADNRRAQDLLRQSRELDPEFADAHAWWAYATVLGMVYWQNDPDPEVLDEALAATRRALQLDPQNAVFHMLRGRVQLARRDYGSALVENQRAVELNPTFAAGYCGLGDSLCYEGRYDEAMAQFEQAVELGAHDPQQWAFLSYGALALLFAGRFEEAAEWAQRAAGIPNCQYWTTAHLVVALVNLGRPDEADRTVEKLLEDCPEFTIDFAKRKLFYLKRPEQLELYLQSLRDAGVPEG